MSDESFEKWWATVDHLELSRMMYKDSYATAWQAAAAETARERQVLAGYVMWIENGKQPFDIEQCHKATEAHAISRRILEEQQ